MIGSSGDRVIESLSDLKPFLILRRVAEARQRVTETVASRFEEASFDDPMSSHAFGGGIPDEFVDLEAEAGGDVVGQDPFGELLGVEEAMGGVAGAAGFFLESWRKENGIDAAGEIVLADEVAGEFVVGAIGENEFQFVVSAKRVQILEREGIGFAGMGTLHVDNLDDFFGDMRERALATGFEQHLVVGVKELFHERDYFALLQHGFAAGDLD